MALIKVGAIQIARGMGPCAEFEHDRRQVQLQNGLAHRGTLVGQFLQRRADEDTQALIGCADDAACGRPIHPVTLP